MRRFPLDAGALPAPRGEGGRVLLVRIGALPRRLSVAGLGFAVLAKGSATVRDGTRSYRADAGSFVLLAPRSAAEISAAEGDATLFLLEVGSAYLPPAAALPMTLVYPATAHAGAAWLGEQARSWEGMASAGTMIEAGAGQAGAVAAALHDRLSRLSARRVATRVELLRRLEAARALLDGAEAPIPMKLLARDIGLSPFHLARSFTAVFGETPAAYHRARRLEGARTALESGIRPADLWAQLGFGDQASFTHAFRRRFGTTPGQTGRGARED